MSHIILFPCDRFVIREHSNGTLHLYEADENRTYGQPLPFSKVVYSPNPDLTIKWKNGETSPISVEELLLEERELNLIFASVRRRKPAYRWRQFVQDRKRFLNT